MAKMQSADAIPSLRSYMSTSAARYIKGNALRWQTFFILALICLWEGLPFSLFGMSNVVGYQVYATLIFSTSFLYCIRSLINKEKWSYWGTLSFCFFLYTFLCSFTYSVIIKPQPLQAWAFAIYTVSPLFTIFTLRFIKANTGDCLNAILIAGFLGSVTVISVQLSQSHLLDFYIRGSAFGAERRVVFFKLESAFSAAILSILLMNFRSIGKYFLHLIAFVACAYNLFFLTESRLAMLAFFAAFLLAWLFIFRTKRKIIALSIAPIALTPLIFYFVDKFLGRFESLDKYLANDMSSRWRMITVKEFSNYFSETYGMGFGFMSGNPIYNNVIAHSANFGGLPYGLRKYGLYLDDIGIYSALYQYGYIGFILTVAMTFLCIFKLGTAYRISRAYEPVSACGFMMAALLISPISLNYFTVFYTAHIGGLLWFMASRIDAEQLIMKTNYFHRFRGVK